MDAKVKLVVRYAANASQALPLCDQRAKHFLGESQRQTLRYSKGREKIIRSTETFLFPTAPLAEKFIDSIATRLAAIVGVTSIKAESWNRGYSVDI